MKNIYGDFSREQRLKFVNFFRPMFFYTDKDRLTPLKPFVNCWWNNFKPVSFTSSKFQNNWQRTFHY